MDVACLMKILVGALFAWILRYFLKRTAIITTEITLYLLPTLPTTINPTVVTLILFIMSLLVAATRTQLLRVEEWKIPTTNDTRILLTKNTMTTEHRVELTVVIMIIIVIMWVAVPRLRQAVIVY